MRFASLGSGSEGNALVVEAGKSRALIDCGFSQREAVRRLARLGLEPERISGIVVTHEHSDHAGGVFGLARRYGIKVWITHGTLAALLDDDSEMAKDTQASLVSAGEVFSVGAIEFLPYTVPHDAREPVQFIASDGARRLGVLTDAGCSTPHLERVLSGCDALVLETNHDAEMLRTGQYPAALKARIAGRFGHLDNGASAAILAAMDRKRLQHVVAAHVSKANNTPALARGALAAAMHCAEEWIEVADQSNGFDWRDIA